MTREGGALLKPRRNLLDPRYLKHWLNTPATVGEMTGNMTGSAIRRLVLRQIRSARILLAPLPEQKRIGDKLDALLARVDACRERLDCVPGILKRFRQSVLAAATSGELTREWREERGLELAGWTRSTVGHLIDGIEAGLNVQCEERPPTEGERGLVKISAVTWGIYDDDESKTLPRSADVPERSRIRTGDFLISRANTLELVGACVIAHRVTRPVFLSDKVLRLVMPEEWKPWLLLVLQSPAGRRDIEERASGNQLSMRNLSQANLREVGVPIPSPEERAEIVRRVRSLLEFAGALERRCRKERSILEKLRPSLLVKAFRGELVPQDPNDEPAAKLLARLRTRPSAAGNIGKPKRGGARGPRTKAKADTTMLTRKDVTPNHLTTILKERGSLTAEALRTASQLEIDDFYDRLKDEKARGLWRENRGDSPTAPRVLEAAA